MKFFIVRIVHSMMVISPFNGRFRVLHRLFYLGNLHRCWGLRGPEYKRDGCRIQTRPQGLRRRGRRCFGGRQCLSTWEAELFSFIGFVSVIVRSRGLSRRISPDILCILNPERRVISRGNVIIGGTGGATGRPNPAQDRQNEARFRYRL